MESFASIADFVDRLRLLQERLPDIERTGLTEAGEMLVKAAQGMIGTEREAWPPLADSTVAEKQRLGFTGRISDTDPLYRTGELRLSISSQVDRGSSTSGVTLGSTDPLAPFLEHGTSRMPPRPFIGAAMFQHEHEAAEIVAEHIVAAMAFRRPRH